MHQDSSLDFKLVQRVCLLQQALDQALYSIEELRSQAEERQWLESQLVKTEKYTNVQQQAITHLKAQLANLTASQAQLLQTVRDRLDHLVDNQQILLNRLQLQLQQSEAELQTYLQHLRDHCQDWQTLEISADAQRLELEAEVMIARSVTISLSSQYQTAHRYIHALASVLTQYHGDISQLMPSVEEISPLPDPAASPVGQPSLSSGAESEPAQADPLNGFPEIDLGALRYTIRSQQLRIHELELALSAQFAQQTQLKQRCQMLAAERDYYKSQLAELQAQHTPGETAIAPEGAVLYPWQRRLRLQPPPPIQPLQIQDEGA